MGHYWGRYDTRDYSGIEFSLGTHLIKWPEFQLSLRLSGIDFSLV
jgi:hypothetical protein